MQSYTSCSPELSSSCCPAWKTLLTGKLTSSTIALIVMSTTAVQSWQETHSLKSTVYILLAGEVVIQGSSQYIKLIGYCIFKKDKLTSAFITKTFLSII